MLFPRFFQTCGKSLCFQNRAYRLSVFLTVGAGYVIEKSDAAFFVSVRVGQKGSSQRTATGRKALISFKPFAELFRQHGKGFCLIQTGMAIGRKFRGGQTVTQCLFWGKRLSCLVDQQAMLQSKLNRCPGKPPRAGIVGFRRKQILSAPDDRP